MPVITNPVFDYTKRLVEELEVGVILDQEQVPSANTLLMQCDYDKFLKGVEQVRKEYNLRNNISKLKDIYNSIL